MLKIELLEKKWGKLNRANNYLYNGDVDYISKKTKLNFIFDKIDYALYKDVYGKLGLEIPPDLKNFYDSYNGCRLFFGSLNVFGIQINRKDEIVPFDIFLTNTNNLGKMKKADMQKYDIVNFGSLGGQYLFGYKKDDAKTIYCTENGSVEVVKKYKDFDNWLDTYFDYLINEYDSDCKKIHPNKEYEGTPVLENLTYKLI